MALLLNRYRKRTQLAALSVALLLSSASFAADLMERTISRSEWPEFANGANVAGLPQLQQILAQFEERPGTRIEIRYPGGLAGEQWGSSLSDWFVAYGVPLGFIDLGPGSGGSDQLLILLVTR